ncbi:hypothetical protein CMI47_11790 [Candidatus Pacearchaeota archaeon]|nr:hypothetical protein [Candidatus Pacearchaeota archaeon]
MPERLAPGGLGSADGVEDGTAQLGHDRLEGLGVPDPLRLGGLLLVLDDVGGEGHGLDAHASGGAEAHVAGVHVAGHGGVGIHVAHPHGVTEDVGEVDGQVVGGGVAAGDAEVDVRLGDLQLGGEHGSEAVRGEGDPTLVGGQELKDARVLLEGAGGRARDEEVVHLPPPIEDLLLGVLEHPDGVAAVVGLDVPAGGGAELVAGAEGDGVGPVARGADEGGEALLALDPQEGQHGGHLDLIDVDRHLGLTGGPEVHQGVAAIAGALVDDVAGADADGLAGRALGSPVAVAVHGAEHVPRIHGEDGPTGVDAELAVHHAPGRLAHRESVGDEVVGIVGQGVDHALDDGVHRANLCAGRIDGGTHFRSPTIWVCECGWLRGGSPYQEIS